MVVKSDTCCNDNWLLQIRLQTCAHWNISDDTTNHNRTVFGYESSTRWWQSWFHSLHVAKVQGHSQMENSILFLLSTSCFGDVFGKILINSLTRLIITLNVNIIDRSTFRYWKCNVFVVNRAGFPTKKHISMPKLFCWRWENTFKFRWIFSFNEKWVRRWVINRNISTFLLICHAYTLLLEYLWSQLLLFSETTV